VPIDEELAAGIRGQQELITSRWPAGTPVLFPRPLRNITGQHTMTSGTYRDALYRWLERCDIRDEHGEPVHLTPHQWRHTRHPPHQPRRPPARRAEDPRPRLC
jgi:integrase